MFKFLLAALLIVGAYAAITPYRTVQNLTQALENEDAAKVDEYVDFDAVRAAFADDFATRMNLKAAPPSSVGSILGTSIATAFIGNIVSPETMVTVLKDKTRRDRMGLSTSPADLAARGKWQGLDSFVLYNDSNQPTALLQREGLHWQVTALRIP